MPLAPTERRLRRHLNLLQQDGLPKAPSSTSFKESQEPSTALGNNPAAAKVTQWLDTSSPPVTTGVPTDTNLASQTQLGMNIGQGGANYVVICALCGATGHDASVCVNPAIATDAESSNVDTEEFRAVARLQATTKLDPVGRRAVEPPPPGEKNALKKPGRTAAARKEVAMTKGKEKEKEKGTEQPTPPPVEPPAPVPQQRRPPLAPAPAPADKQEPSPPGEKNAPKKPGRTAAAREEMALTKGKEKEKGTEQPTSPPVEPPAPVPQQRPPLAPTPAPLDKQDIEDNASDSSHGWSAPSAGHEDAQPLHPPVLHPGEQSQQQQNYIPPEEIIRLRRERDEFAEECDALRVTLAAAEARARRADETVARERQAHAAAIREVEAASESERARASDLRVRLATAESREAIACRDANDTAEQLSAKNSALNDVKEQLAEMQRREEKARARAAALEAEARDRTMAFERATARLREEFTKTLGERDAAKKAQASAEMMAASRDAAAHEVEARAAAKEKAAAKAVAEALDAARASKVDTQAAERRAASIEAEALVAKRNCEKAMSMLGELETIREQLGTRRNRPSKEDAAGEHRARATPAAPHTPDKSQAKEAPSAQQVLNAANAAVHAAREALANRKAAQRRAASEATNVLAAERERLRRSAPAELLALGLWTRCILLGVGSKGSITRVASILSSLHVTGVHAVRLNASAWPTNDADRKPLDDMLARAGSIVIVDEGAEEGAEAFLGGLAKHVTDVRRRTVCMADDGGATTLRAVLPKDDVHYVPITPPIDDSQTSQKGSRRVHPLAWWIGPPDLAYSILPMEARKQLAQTFGAATEKEASIEKHTGTPSPPSGVVDLFHMPGLAELHLSLTSRPAGVSSDAYAAVCELLACHCARHCATMAVLRVDTVVDARSALRIADAALEGGFLDKLSVAGGPLLPIRALLRGELAALELSSSGASPCAPLGATGSATLLRVLKASPQGVLASVGLSNASLGAAPAQPPHLRSPDAPLVCADVHALARHLLEEQSSLAHGFGVTLDAWLRPSRGPVVAPPDGLRMAGAPLGALGAALLSQLLLSVRPGLDVGILDLSECGLDAAGIHDVCAAAGAAEVAIAASPSRLAFSGNDVGDDTSRASSTPATASAAAAAAAVSAALGAVGRFAASSLCAQLELRSCGLGKRGVSELARGLRGCRALVELDLGGNPGVGDDGIKPLCASLSRAPKLASVSLSCCGLGDAGAGHVSRLVETLVRLDLSGNPSIGAEGIRALVLALSAGGASRGGPRESNGEPPSQQTKMPSLSLTYLDVSRCSLGLDGARHLAALLALVPSRLPLRELRAAACKLHPDGVVKHVAPALRRAWSSSTGVASVDLRRNGFGDTGAEALAGALTASSKGLTSLDVRGNAMSDGGARAILDALRSGGAPRLTDFKAAHAGGGRDGAAWCEAAEELCMKRKTTSSS
ncbi:hypothetical protein RI054_38g142740 [Pseudoscourfieldia marina]